MKKSTLIKVISTFFLFVTCTSTKPIRQTEKVLKGVWTLTNVTYSRPGNFNVKLYNDASSSCFEGSVWNFIPNNNTATYQFTKNDCDTTLKNVKWTIPVKENQNFYSFLMKPLTIKRKSIEGNKGFRTRIENIDASTMKWSQNLQFEGKPFKITMNFNKNN